MLVLAVWPVAGNAATAGADAVLEELHYQVDAWIWRDAARAHLTLRRLAADRYLVQVSGETQGLAALLSGNRRDRFETEMVLQNGRLVPLIYREDSQRRGKRRFKEYRFLYGEGRLELWRWKDGKGLERRWDTPLKEPIYDPLSAFYNGRLGLLGPMKEGDSIKIPGIPFPEPEEITVHMRAANPEGRKIMVSLVNRAYEDQKGVIYVDFNQAGAPALIWSRLPRFGKVEVRLLPQGQVLKEKLL